MISLSFEICIINPYKTDLLTDKIEATAFKTVSSQNKILMDKQAIEDSLFDGYYDESVNVTNLIKEIENNQTSDAFIITCFEDPGINIARSIKSKLILGLGEASFYIANIIGKNFSIITPISRSNEAIKNNLIKYGLNDKCVSLNSIEVPVLDLETMSKSNLLKLKNEIKRTMLEDKAEAIILCSPGIMRLTQELEKEFQIPIIEGVSAAVAMIEMLLKLNYKVNKLGSNDDNTNKNYDGYFSQFLRRK